MASTPCVFTHTCPASMLRATARAFSVSRLHTDPLRPNGVLLARTMDARALSHLFHLRALKIGADGQGTRVILLHVRHCRIEIEIPDVTQYELLRIRALRHSSHYGGESLDGIGRAHPDGRMRDEDVRTLRKIREARIGAGLVRAVDNGKPLRLHAVGERGEIAVRDTQCRHLDAIPIIDSGRLLLGYVHHTRIKLHSGSRP